MAFMMEWIRPEETVLTAKDVKKLPVGAKVRLHGEDRHGEHCWYDCTVVQSGKKKVLRASGPYSAMIFDIRDTANKVYTR